MQQTSDFFLKLFELSLQLPIGVFQLVVGLVQSAKLDIFFLKLAAKVLLAGVVAEEGRVLLECMLAGVPETEVIFLIVFLKRTYGGEFK
jgi:hypothetical protein